MHNSHRSDMAGMAMMPNGLDIRTVNDEIRALQQQQSMSLEIFSKEVLFVCTGEDSVAFSLRPRRTECPTYSILNSPPLDQYFLGLVFEYESISKNTKYEHQGCQFFVDIYSLVRRSIDSLVGAKWLNSKR